MIKLRRPLCLYSIAFVLLLWIIMHFFDADNSMRLPIVNGETIEAEGIVSGITYKNDKTNLYLTHITVRNIQITRNLHIRGLIVYLPTDYKNTFRIRHGSRIRFVGRLYNYDRVNNDGQFDINKYYYIRGVDGYVSSATVTGTDNNYDIISHELFTLKERIKKVYRYYFNEDDTGIVETMVLGDKEDLSDEIKQDFRDSGISHILALSGLHIATLGIFIFSLLKRLRIHMVPAGMITALCMFLYCIMTGFSTSAIRAFIMFCIAVLAQIIGRTYDIKTATALAIIIILIENPYYMYDSGFVLSFMAMAGISLVHPSIKQLTDLFLKRKKRMDYTGLKGIFEYTVKRVIDSLVFSFSIQLAILPVSMYYFFSFPLYGMLLNLIVVPLATILLVLSVITAIFGYMAIFGSFLVSCLNICAKTSAYFASLIIRLYRLLTQKSLMLPDAVIITGQPLIVQMCVYYIVLLIILVIVKALIKKHEESRRNLRYEITERIKKHAVILIIVILADFVFLFVRFRSQFEISALSVGQGQCVVIHGSRTKTVVYDCGSTDESSIGKYKVIPFLKSKGINEIEVFFVSHLDSDHVNGLIEILEDEYYVNIKNIVIPKVAVCYKNENYKKLISLATAKGILVHEMKSYDEIKINSMHISCLSPDNKYSKDYDINQGSLVLDVSYEFNNNVFSALLAGDIDRRVLDTICPFMKNGYNYYLVAHHGSNSAFSNTFYQSKGFSLAVISAGENNIYGHPHKEILTALSDAGVASFITYKHGETDCIVSNRGMKINTYY